MIAKNSDVPSYLAKPHKKDIPDDQQQEFAHHTTFQQQNWGFINFTNRFVSTIGAQPNAGHYSHNR